MRMRLPALALATAMAVLLLPAAPALAVDDDVTVSIQGPDEFRAGAGAATVNVVASTDERGQRCRKVRWSMLLRVSGAEIDQLRVDRVEDDASFPVQVRTEGDAARLTDRQLDPGQLCRGRTVTAVYRIAFTGDAPAGEVRLEASAFDRRGELIQSAGATRTVAGEEPEGSPSPTPSESESAEPEESEEPEAAVPPAAAPDAEDLAQAAGEGGTPSLLGPGLIVGAVLVFLGVGLLMRIRLRNRKARRHHRGPMIFTNT